MSSPSLSSSYLKDNGDDNSEITTITKLSSFSSSISATNNENDESNNTTIDFNYDNDNYDDGIVKKVITKDENTDKTTQTTTKAQLLAMISNFSTSYNVINISLVLPMTYNVYNITNKDIFESLCTSTLLGGMIVGQLVGGALGDVIGRLSALYIMMILQIISSIGSSLTFSISSITDDDSDDSFYIILSIWRFILGIGCGGIYPLAAVLSTESNTANTTNNDNENEVQRWKRMACTFSTQGFGFWIAPIISWICVVIYGDESDIGWRIVLFIGSIPGLLVIILKGYYDNATNNGNNNDISAFNEERHLDSKQLQYSSSSNLSCCDCLQLPLLQKKQHQPQHSHSRINHTYDDEDDNSINDEHFEEEPISINKTNERKNNNNSSSLYYALSNEPKIIKKLLGTAFIWFLFDILFYGNTLFEPIVLSSALGNNDRNNSSSSDNDTNDDDDLTKVCRNSFILSSIALPGYIIGAYLIGNNKQQRPKYIQMRGFVIMSILYAVIGLGWPYWKKQSSLLLLLYGSTFFFANYGPNMTTFILPSITFSESCRSTLNGISAACGKFGAFIGSIVFIPLCDKYNDSVIMFLCSMLAIISFVLTWLCVSDIVIVDVTNEEEQHDNIKLSHDVEDDYMIG